MTRAEVIDLIGVALAAVGCYLGYVLLAAVW